MKGLYEGPIIMRKISKKLKELLLSRFLQLWPNGDGCIQENRPLKNNKPYRELLASGSEPTSMGLCFCDGRCFYLSPRINCRTSHGPPVSRDLVPPVIWYQGYHITGDLIPPGVPYHRVWHLRHGDLVPPMIWCPGYHYIAGDLIPPGVPYHCHHVCHLRHGDLVPPVISYP